MNSKSTLRTFFINLRKKRIIEILAAFIGGGWLLVEVVERLLVGHYRFPDKTIDVTVVSIIGAWLATLVWRWFCGKEKRPGNIKVEILLVPLIILATLAVDLIILLEIIGIGSKAFLIAAVAVCIGIAWIILKSLQWAAAAPTSSSGLVQVTIESPSMAAIPHARSIVVLPFTDLSPQKDQEYFCDGMTEEIIADLSHVHELLVISRSSAMTFKGSSKTVREIAKDLNIRFVMEGSVRKAGNDLRITAQLIDAANDAHVWAEKYSGILDNVFDIQEKVSRSILEAMKLKLTPQETTRITSRPIANVQVYELHLRARYEMLLLTEDGLGRALQLIENGLKILGDNEILYADMGHVYTLYIGFGIKKDESIFNKADEYIKKVFAMNPNSSSGHYLKGMIHHRRGEAQASVRELKRSLAIDSNYPDAIMWLSWVYAHSGKGLAARHQVRQLLEIDPLYPLTQLMAGAIEVLDGKFDSALTAIKKARELERENPFLGFWYAKALAYAQHYEEARALFDLIIKDEPWANLSSFFNFALQKKKSEARQTLTEEFLKRMREDELFPIWIAESFALINQKDEAIDWIENGVKWGFINYPFLAEYDPFLANIRGDERFLKLMERVKQEWEHFEV